MGRAALRVGAAGPTDGYRVGAAPPLAVSGAFAMRSIESYLSSEAREDIDPCVASRARGARRTAAAGGGRTEIVAA
jgi:hypothetical protein